MKRKPTNTLKPKSLDRENHLKALAKRLLDDGTVVITGGGIENER